MNGSFANMPSAVANGDLVGTARRPRHDAEYDQAQRGPAVESWSLRQWEARSRLVASRLDPRFAAACRVFVDIGGSSGRLTRVFAWFDAENGPRGCWLAEDRYMRQEWAEFTAEWDVLQAAARARARRFDSPV